MDEQIYLNSEQWKAMCTLLEYFRSCDPYTICPRCDIVPKSFETCSSCMKPLEHKEKLDNLKNAVTNSESGWWEKPIVRAWLTLYEELRKKEEYLKEIEDDIKVLSKGIAEFQRKFVVVYDKPENDHTITSVCEGE